MQLNIYNSLQDHICHLGDDGIPKPAKFRHAVVVTRHDAGDALFPRPVTPRFDLRFDFGSNSTSNQPGGNPIIAVTQAGLSFPATRVIGSNEATLSARELFGVLPDAFSVSGFRAPFSSRAVTVGNRATPSMSRASVSLSSPFATLSCIISREPDPSNMPRVLAVGHSPFT